MPIKKNFYKPTIEEWSRVQDLIMEYERARAKALSKDRERRINML